MKAALVAATQAAELRRSPDYLDTLACVYAYVGDFNKAIGAVQEALRIFPGNPEYERHLDRFKTDQRDCTQTE
jgi:tetratricopeptide (TPR) repeat protein